jgi:hypothetical protein
VRRVYDWCAAVDFWATKWEPVVYWSRILGRIRRDWRCTYCLWRAGTKRRAQEHKAPVWVSELTERMTEAHNGHLQTTTNGSRRAIRASGLSLILSYLYLQGNG